MTEQERINQTLQRQIDAQNSRIDLLGAKFDALNDKIDTFIEESRLARTRQDEDIREMQTRFYSKFDAIDAKFDKISDQIHTMTIAAVVGFGAIAAEVGGLVFAAFK